MSSNFNEERKIIKYITLKEECFKYSIENCISNVKKIGLSETEKECIKNRTYTFISYYKDFLISHSNDFDK